jgi:hypothetical protein
MYAVCECGIKIPLAPDVAEMAHNVVEHAKKHVKNEADPEKANAERCRIEQLLTKKVLTAVSNFELDSITAMIPQT